MNKKMEHLKELRRIQAVVHELAPKWRLNFYEHREDIEQILTDTRNLAAEIGDETADHDLVRAANTLEEMYWRDMEDLKID